MVTREVKPDTKVTDAKPAKIKNDNEEQTTLCPHCRKVDINYTRYGRCYWMPIYEAL